MRIKLGVPATYAPDSRPPTTTSDPHAHTSTTSLPQQYGTPSPRLMRSSEVSVPYVSSPLIATTLKELFIHYRLQRACSLIDRKGIDSSWESLASLGNRRPSDITDEVVSDWIAEQRLVRKHADSTIKKHVKLLRRVLCWGADQGVLLSPPKEWRCVETLDDEPRRRYMNTDECKKLIATAGVMTIIEKPAPWWLGPLVSLLFATAQRVEAILNLKWEQVSPQAIDFTDYSDPLRKRRKPRGIFPLPDQSTPTQLLSESQAFIFELMTNLRIRMNGPYVLHWWDGRKVSYSSAREHFQKLVRFAGLSPDVTLHTVRHSVAARLIRQGINMTEVAVFLGHKSSVVTEEVYGHLRKPDFVGKAAREAGRLLAEVYK